MDGGADGGRPRAGAACRSRDDSSLCARGRDRSARPLKEYAEQEVDAPLTLQIQPGRDGQLLLYEDDGRSFDYRKGDWMGLRVSWQDSERRLSLRLADGSRLRPPLRRPIEARVVGTKRAGDLLFEGKPLDVKL